MERLPQELVDKIIDHVDHPDLGACSLVGRRWVERSHWNWIWGGGYFSFIDQRQFDSPRKNLLTEGSTFAEHIHTLTLGSTAVQAWTDYFCNVDVVLPRLDSIIIIDARLHLDSDVAVLKRNFGNTLLSLSLNKVAIGYKEFHAILSSFPNLDNLSIARLNLPQSPPGDTLPVLGRRLPIQFRRLHFCDTADFRKIHPLVHACSSTLTTLKIRDDVPRAGERGPPLATRNYLELQTIRFTLAGLVKPQNFVALVFSSIASAPKLSEVSFVFTRATLDRDLDYAVSLTEWKPVDGQLRRLAQQSIGGVTATFDFLTKQGWTPREDDTEMSFMGRFRRFGVMKLRSFGEDVATYYPRA